MNVIDSIANKFLIPSNLVRQIAHQAPYKYKFYFIKKRHGGKREIASPTKSIKILQRYLLKEYLSGFNIHNQAYAYVKNRNIKQHAMLHVGNKFLLKLDFYDFFNSITSDDLAEFLQSKFSGEDVEVLVNFFCCFNKEKNKKYLSIGAPSSPKISNIILYEFDNKVDQFCRENNICYSRYADDLAFSTNEPYILKKILLPAVIRVLANLTTPKQISLNEEKIIFTSRKYKRKLTGLILSNDGSVSIGRDKKRILRAKAHNYHNLMIEEKLNLDGYISFLSEIDAEFAEVLKNKISKGNL